MSERDFEVSGKKFKLNKLDVMKQYHLVRKLTPILGELIPMVKKLGHVQEVGAEQFEAFIPIFNGISNLSDKDAEFVLFSLLSAVEMQQGSGNWAKVATDQQLLFHNLDFKLVMQIAARSFAFNLQSFLVESP